MNDELKRELIRDAMAANPGIKAVQLVSEVTSEVMKRIKAQAPSLGNDNQEGKNVVDIINAMVKEGELVEVEYVLPTMVYRVKSVYFPKGTIVRIVS